MEQREKQLTASATILSYMFMAFDMMPRPFESKTHYVKRFFSGRTDYWSYYRAMIWLEKKGYIKIFKEHEHKFIALTKKGRVKALFERAHVSNHGTWDGKWRMVVFDIPEEARHERRALRKLLAVHGFKPIQKSVYISPYPFHGAALQYLHETELDTFIRIFRIDSTDNNDEFKKLFSLK